MRSGSFCSVGICFVLFCFGLWCLGGSLRHGSFKDLLDKQVSKAVEGGPGMAEDGWPQIEDQSGVEHRLKRCSSAIKLCSNTFLYYFFQFYFKKCFQFFYFTSLYRESTDSCR